MSITTERLLRDAKAFALEHRKLWPYAGVFILCSVIYLASATRDEVVHIYKSEKTPDFKDARILGFQGDSIYEGKEKLLAKTIKDLKDAQTALKESNDRLQAKMDELERGKASPGATPTNDTAYGPNPLPDNKALLAKEPIHVGPPPTGLIATPVVTNVEHFSSAGGPGRVSRLGSSLISFPVKDVPVEKTEGIVLPAGSYVKGKLMTGVEAPEGKTYPVLMQLDYAYIVPNHKKLDLSGCFMIAKSQGDLSTERVQMQATKLSCVSKNGRMFERDVNGFIADDKDNSFAVMGSVNSKQDRVATMAFLSSIVEGVGKAIQQAQTTQQMTPLGGAQSMLTGNQMEYIGAGGAANAASMVTSWYLKQAQNLLPTINVGSGQDIWIVMQDTVKLPNDYFKKNDGGANESVYTYFSRIVD